MSGTGNADRKCFAGVDSCVFRSALIYFKLMRRTVLIMASVLALSTSLHAATPVEKLRVTRKLKSIVVPEVTLRDATIHDAFQFIVNAGREADKKEIDPLKKGVNMVLKLDPETSNRTISFQVRYVSLLQLLDIIVGIADLKYRIEKGYVIILPRNAPGGKISTRFYNVEPEAVERILKPVVGK